MSIAEPISPSSWCSTEWQSCSPVYRLLLPYQCHLWICFQHSPSCSMQLVAFLTQVLHGQAMFRGQFFAIHFLWIWFFCDLRKLSLRISFLDSSVSTVSQGFMLTWTQSVLFRHLQSGICFPCFTLNCFIITVSKVAVDHHSSHPQPILTAAN